MATTTHSAKVCCVCGVDVSQKKRTKDSQGNYYCNPCYQARVQETQQVRRLSATPSQSSSASYDASGDDLASLAAAVEGVGEFEGEMSIAPAPPPPDYACSVCHGLFAANEVYNAEGEFVCKSCHAARGSPVSSSRPPLKNQYKAPRTGRSHLIWAVAAIVVLLVIGGAYVGFERYQYAQYTKAVTPLLEKVRHVELKVDLGLKRDEMAGEVSTLKRVRDECEGQLSARQKKLSSWWFLSRAVDSYAESLEEWDQQLTANRYGDSMRAKVHDSMVQLKWTYAKSQAFDARQMMKKHK